MKKRERSVHGGVHHSDGLSYSGREVFTKEGWE